MAIVDELGTWQELTTPEGVVIRLLVEPSEEFRLRYQGAWLHVVKEGTTITATATHLAVAEFEFAVNGVKVVRPVVEGRATLEIDVAEAASEVVVIAATHPEYGYFSREVEV